VSETSAINLGGRAAPDENEDDETAIGEVRARRGRQDGEAEATRAGNNLRMMARQTIDARAEKSD
jgi:hypothetical protein